ncbi:MAG: hypothetical protein ACR2Q4_11115 [Geminicoccaceae bacterium]
MNGDDHSRTSQADHWLVRGMGGVNIITLLVLILGGAKLYFELDKDIALMKRDIADIKADVRQFRRTSYAWPPPTTRSATPQNP